tara:strand:+ start:2207 stop:2476 length:270 start_codon:yes stop_codon:yes gene_type:complete
MEIELKKYISITESDFKDTRKLNNVNFNGSLTFNEVPISNIYSNSEILKNLKEIIEEHKIDENKYDIFFKRNKEWFNRFIFYKKNEQNF